MSPRAKHIVLLVVCIAVPLLIGFASSLIAGDIRGIYESLVQAPLSPPGWLFGVVWSVLYTLMGIALYRIIRSKHASGKAAALVVFAVQLILNFAWSIVFFGNDLLWFAFAIILALDIAVIACIVAFYRCDKAAAVLMVPYLLWICFATYLNLAFALLN